jgi:hypothetical protein
MLEVALRYLIYVARIVKKLASVIGKLFYKKLPHCSLLQPRNSNYFTPVNTCINRMSQRMFKLCKTKQKHR